MSDIWIKKSNTNPKWAKATAIHIKRFSGATTKWFAAKVIWIKNTSSGWLRVWPTSGVFAITDPYITTTSSGSTPLYGNNTIAANDVIRIGTAYYGRNGTWDPNGFTISSYSYSWPYYSSSDASISYDEIGSLASGVYSSPSQALTISSSTNANATDGNYISFRITANASNALYSNTADSRDSYGKIQVIRRTPINISFQITGSATVGSVLSFGSSWNITEARKPNASRTIIKWYRSNSATDIYSGGGRTEITSASGLYQYTLVEADSGKYIVAEETTFNTGSDYDIGVDQFINGQNQVTAVSSLIMSAYSFAFGNTLYVGSNGYIGLDNGGSLAGTAGNGRNVNIWNEDLVQYRLQEYSDSSNYHLYFRAYRYQSPLVRSAINALDYQIKFYTGQPYCDVYLVRKGNSVPTYIDNPGYYSNGLFGTSGFSGTFVAGSVLRVYFDGTTPANTSAASWTAISDNVWKDITTSDIDDSFTSVVTSANQSAPIPTNTVLPTLTTDTGNFSAGSTITVNPGTWTNTNSYAYELLYGTSTPISDTSSSTKTLVDTNTYVITNADATASSYYFRGRVTGYANSGQTGASTIALSATSSRSYINSTTTISVGTATSSGFTISGIASPPVYTSISSIQIFNSSQTLISTITTGLPSVDSSTGAWSYIWTGGSSSTTYYAKVTVIASDSAVTTFTTAFSSSITTSAGVSTPTALAATNNSGAIRLTFSGGSGDQYDVFYQNSASRPTDGQAFADYPNVTSPYDPPLTQRDITRWFWVRKSTGTLRSNWYPSDSSVSIRLPLLSPRTPTITNSAQSSTSLSWHWDQPTPLASQDEPTSWDYNISTSTATPSSWTNITTRPTSGSPLVTGSLTASTTYYLHVRAKNADNSTTTYQSGTTSATPVAPPSAPTGLSVSRSVGSNFMSTSLSPSASGNGTKTQTWSFGRNTTFTINFTRGANATSSEMYYSTSFSTPSSSTSQNGGTSTSSSGNFSYVGAASTTSNNDYAVYFWVRSTTSTQQSAWTYAGTQDVDTPTYTGFEIRLYRTNTSSGNFTTQNPGRNALTYSWTSVALGFAHQAQVRLTFDGTQLIRSS
jgi:trimeric autotransporter adhesin